MQFWSREKPEIWMWKAFSQAWSSTFCEIISSSATPLSLFLVSKALTWRSSLSVSLSLFSPLVSQCLCAVPPLTDLHVQFAAVLLQLTCSYYSNPACPLPLSQRLFPTFSVAASKSYYTAHYCKSPPRSSYPVLLCIPLLPTISNDISQQLCFYRVLGKHLMHMSCICFDPCKPANWNCANYSRCSYTWETLSDKLNKNDESWEITEWFEECDPS